MSSSCSTTYPESNEGDKSAQAEESDVERPNKRTRDHDDDDDEKKTKEAVRPRQVHTNCYCGDCEDGVIVLNESCPNSSFRCECTLCGPLDEDGNRRCVIGLDALGAFLSRKIDKQLICFDCRSDG